MKQLVLYSTLACHLCELALDEISACLDGQEGWLLEEIDIADDPVLLQAYGTSIPVLYFPLANQGLYWPFDRFQVEQFLHHIQKIE